MQSPKENIKYIELEELEELDENDYLAINKGEHLYNNYIIIITIGDEKLDDLKIDRIFNIDNDIILKEYYQEKLNKQNKSSIHDHMNIDDYNNNITDKSKNKIKKLIIFYSDINDDTKFKNNIYYYDNYDLISEIFNLISPKPKDTYNIGKKYILEKENQQYYIYVDFISIIILLYEQGNAILIIYYSNNNDLLNYLLSRSIRNGLETSLTKKKPSIRCNKKIFLDLYNTFNIIN